MEYDGKINKNLWRVNGNGTGGVSHSGAVGIVFGGVLSIRKSARSRRDTWWNLRRH